MIKAFSAIAAAAFIAAALTVLPGFAPQVEASVPQALAKGDRLDIRTVGKDCSQQAWPNFEAEYPAPPSVLARFPAIEQICTTSPLRRSRIEGSTA